MIKQGFGLRSANCNVWMAQMIEYAVTGTFFTQLAHMRGDNSDFPSPPASNVLALPILPESDYIPEPAANQGPLPEAA